MPKSQLLASTQEFNNQYVFFKIAHIVGALVMWSYFAVLLLRTANSPIEAVPLVVIHHALLYLGLLGGFFISARLIPAYGYLTSFRISNALEMLVSLLALALMSQIGTAYIFISLLGGIARGIFWNTNHMFNTVEIGHVERSRLISVIYSLEQLLGVVMPILIGAVLSVMGYQVVFIAGAFTYLVATIYPWGYHKIPKDTLNLSDFKAITKQTGFKRWSCLMIFEGFTSNARVMVLAVLPFLFIGNEFGVGVLGTLMGLLGALTTFGHRNDKFLNKFGQGLFGSAIIYVSTLGLLVFWSLPALVIRSLFSQFGFAFFTPIESEINYHLKEMVLSDFKNKLAIELQQFAEVFMFAGRFLSILFFVVGQSILGISIEVMLMWLLGFSLIREPFILLFGRYLSSAIKDHRHSAPELSPRSLSIV